MVCTLLVLFLVPAFLCEDIDEAVKNQYFFLKRVYTNIPLGEDCMGRLLIAYIIYILCVYFLP